MTLDEICEKYKQHEVDFVLPKQSGDVPLYLDLYLFYESPEVKWHEVQALIYHYFNHYLSLYRDGNISEEDLIGALNFPEVREIAFGYCKSGFDGRGGADDRADNIKKSIFDDQAVQEIGIDAVAKMSIEIENVGPDILSDMVASFAMLHLIEYTAEQAKALGIATAEYQVRRVLDTNTWSWKPLLKVQLPYFESTEEPRILVPKHLAKKRPIISAMGFYDNYLRHILRQEMEDRAQIARSIGKRPKVTFEQVEDELKRKYETIGNAARKISIERPDLVGKYVKNPYIFKTTKYRRKKKEDIDWDQYIEELKNIAPGKDQAREYAEFLRKIFTVLYDGQLINGVVEKESVDELFFYDVSFANCARTPFFAQVANQGLKAGVVIIEAKNYGKTDVGNKEFNQGRTYTIADGRDLIFLVMRDDVSKKDIERAQRHFLAQRCILFPLSDSDIIKLINARRKDDQEFDLVLVERLQEILSA